MFTRVFSHGGIGMGQGSQRDFQGPCPCFAGTERGSCTVTSTNCRQMGMKPFGGEGGILFHEVLKIPVLMVKTNPNHVKRYWG
jgi:hypothetical protein